MPSTDLMNALVVSRVAFRIDYGQETSGQAGGQILVKDLRSPLWSMEADCTTLTLHQLRVVRALIGGLGGSRGSFYAWDPAAQFPAADPDGSILGANNVQINSLGADNTSLSLRGLPPGYILTIGDMLAFDFSVSHRALHQVVSTSAVANGAGVTPVFQIHPPLRQGVVLSLPVTLKRAAAEMRLVPGSFAPSVDGMIATAPIKAIQVV